MNSLIEILRTAAGRLQSLVDSMGSDDAEQARIKLDMYVGRLMDTLSQNGLKHEMAAIQEIYTRIDNDTWDEPVGPTMRRKLTMILSAVQGIITDLETETASPATALDPLGSIVAVLHGFNDADVEEIITTTGVPIDWKLSREEEWSRGRTYLQRFLSACHKLQAQDRLRIAQIVATAIPPRGNHHEQQLTTKLAQVGWKLASGTLMPVTGETTEKFFGQGSHHDAYVEIKRIVTQAMRSITIIDGYLNNTVFQMLSALPRQSMGIQLLTWQVPGDFALEARKFVQQHTWATLEIRRTREFHDRFIILDGQVCFHIGTSIKDAGNRAFMISKLEDHNTSQALLSVHLNTWNTATAIPF